MTEARTDRHNVSFEVAEGLEPLPSPLALKEISPELRAHLWRALHDTIEEDGTYRSSYDRPVVTEGWRQTLQHIHVAVAFKAIDEFDPDWKREQLPFLKSIVMESEYGAVFGLLQHILRHKQRPRLAERIQLALERSRAAYTLVDGRTFFPVSNPEEAATLSSALAGLKAAELYGARTHLLKAGELATAGDDAGSIRESIHAVESVARLLDPGASDTLGPALTQLERHAKLNGALKKGFEKLYGYTNSQEGIRHAHLGQGDTQVDASDAQFMLGACASFVSYLIAKARAAGIVLQGK